MEHKSAVLEFYPACGPVVAFIVRENLARTIDLTGETEGYGVFGVVLVETDQGYKVTETFAGPAVAALVDGLAIWPAYSGRAPVSMRLRCRIRRPDEPKERPRDVQPDKGDPSPLYGKLSWLGSGPGGRATREERTIMPVTHLAVNVSLSLLLWAMLIASGMLFLH